MMYLVDAPGYVHHVTMEESVMMKQGYASALQDSWEKTVKLVKLYNPYMAYGV